MRARDRRNAPDQVERVQKSREARAAATRRSRSGIGHGEQLEQRVVLTSAGLIGPSLLQTIDPPPGLLGTALDRIGVVTQPVLAPPTSTGSGTPPGHVFPLETEIQTLQTELASLSAKSGLTLADLASINADNQAIAQQATTPVNVSGLNTAVSELATALTGGSSTTQAQTDFTAAFAGTGVASATITQAFADVSTAITVSGITATDLTAVATDLAPVQAFIPPDVVAGLGPLSLPVVIPSIPPWFTVQVSAVAGTLGPSGPPPVVVIPGSPAAPPSSTGTGTASTPTSIPGSTISQLEADIQALHTEIASVASTSGTTIADLTSLFSDSQAIAQQATSPIDMKSVGAAIDELATAIAAGTPATQAQTDFTAAFASTGVTSATVTQTFNDLTKAITDSGVTTADLTTIAADQAAIQQALSSLHIGGGQPTSPGGSGQPGGGQSGDPGGCMGGGTSPGSGSPGPTTPTSPSPTTPTTPTSPSPTTPTTPTSPSPTTPTSPSPTTPTSPSPTTPTTPTSTIPTTPTTPTGTGTGSTSPTSPTTPTSTGPGSSSPTAGGGALIGPIGTLPLPVVGPVAISDPPTSGASTTGSDSSSGSSDGSASDGSTAPTSTSSSSDGTGSDTSTSSKGHKKGESKKASGHGEKAAIKVHAARTDARVSPHRG